MAEEPSNGTATTSLSPAILLSALAGAKPGAIVMPSEETVTDHWLGDPSRVGIDAAVIRVPVATLLDDDIDELRDALLRQGLPEHGLVLFLPPLGRPQDRPSRHDMSEIAGLNLVRAVPPETDVAVILLPRSIGGVRSVDLIKRLSEARYVSAVMQLPGTVLLRDVHRSLRLCVVHLTANARPWAAFLTLSEPVSADIAPQLNQLWLGKPRTTNGFALNVPFPIDEGLMPSQLDPERDRRISEAQAIGKLHRIDELCEVLQGLRPTADRDRPRQPADLPVLAAARIRPEGILSDDIAEDDTQAWADPEDGSVLQPGDIVIRSINRSDRPLVVAEVVADDLPLIAGPHVLVMRPLNLHDSERRIMRRFVESSRFASQLRSSQLGDVMRLTARELAEAGVPLPDDDLMRAFDAVESAASVFNSWRDESLSLLELSVDAEDLEEARAQLISGSNHLRQRAEAARLLDDLGHRVATRFPLPVAYRWRNALAARGGSGELQSILHTQEVLLAYIAVMALISARAADFDVGHLRDIRQRWHKRRGGVTLGDWRAILTEAAESKAFRRLSATHPFVEVRDFFGNTQALDAANRLASVRNDLSHLREFAPGELVGAIEGAWDDLKTLLVNAEFITEYRLVRVTETQWDSLDEQNHIQYRHLAGDNAVVPLAAMMHPSNTIEANSLYLIDSRSDLHLLRPLMVGAECPSCGHWSTFLPDQVRPDGIVQYKSLEHGHPFDLSESVMRSLAAVGFVEPSTLSGDQQPNDSEP